MIYFFDQSGDVIGYYGYLDAKSKEEYEEAKDAEIGWYPFAELDDLDFSNCQNGLKVPLGSMAVVVTAHSDATIVFSGEVRQEETPLKLVGGFKTYVGNCSPVDITLGDIKPNADFEFDADMIYFFDKSGDVTGYYGYLDAKSKEEYEEAKDADIGWYPFAELDDLDFSNCQNSLPVKAGDSFVVVTAHSTATLTIPPAVKPAKAE